MYHPEKPNQVRMVFDSSPQFNGVSLNDVLLSGPDLANSLLGVLMLFRIENIRIMTDIQQISLFFKLKRTIGTIFDFIGIKTMIIKRIRLITECASMSLVTAHRLVSPHMASKELHGMLNFHLDMTSQLCRTQLLRG